MNFELRGKNDKGGNNYEKINDELITVNKELLTNNKTISQ
jgi:hypothetical protein